MGGLAAVRPVTFGSPPCPRPSVCCFYVSQFVLVSISEFLLLLEMLQKGLQSKSYLLVEEGLPHST